VAREAGGTRSSMLEGETLGGPLVLPYMQPLIGGELNMWAEQAQRVSPESFFARESSRTAFHGLGSSEARTLARKAFPSIIDQRAGALPPLPAGERIVGYPADDAATIELANGKHAVIESTEPIAREAAPRHRVPLNLGLGEVGGAFRPRRTLAQLRIPTRLDRGVELSRSGVALTPLGAGAGAAGVVDGAAVVYANTETDADTLVKPLTGGFEEDTLLRSADSPSELSFRFVLPKGASIMHAGHGSHVIRVVKGGKTIVVVPAPTAQDAEGASVPVSVGLTGDTLSLTVDQRAGGFRYPIIVDPTVNETGGSERKIRFGATWGFFTENSTIFKASEYEYAYGQFGVHDIVSKSVAAGERAFFYYPTQGESRIYSLTPATSFAGLAGSKMEDAVGIENVHTGTPEVVKSWIENGGVAETLCVLSGCATGSVNGSNNKSEVFFRQNARETNEWAGGEAALTSATVGIVQEAGPSSSFVPLEKWVNNVGAAVFLYLKATDPGLGISATEWTSSGTPEWKPGNAVFGCEGVQCDESTELNGNLKGLPEGEDAVQAVTRDPVGLSTTSTTTVKIDNAAPFGITTEGLPENHEISFGHYVLKISATDGSGTTPSSGIASIKLMIDGKEVGTPRGSCPKGPCTGTGEWIVNGEEYAAGKHTLAVIATDGAGNSTKTETTFTIESSESKSVGPGWVDLTSGAYMLGTTDVGIAGAGGGLEIKRSYNSRYPTAGSGGPLGPQWSGLGVGGTQKLTKLPTGSMLLTTGNGRQAVFAKEGSKFSSPIGDASMTLKEEPTNTYVLTEQNGTITTFTLPSGGSGTIFTPSSREEKGFASTVKYTFQTVGGITEPTEVLAPVPAGVTCTTLVKGCRALTFNYATSTTATGESRSQWGDYNGRLTRIYFTAWDPSKSEMTTTTVAQYAYDAKGRLRAEWDPRVSPTLKTTYGYDAEGHVVSLTYPGRETWVFTYMSLASDPNSGRLMKVYQAPASAPLWNGEALGNTAAPTLSGSPVVGIRMAVSKGSWSNEPAGYAYQWDRCNAYGSECSPINGAVNPNYTPVEADVGHALTATVTATNGDGLLSATSIASKVVSASGAPAYVGAIGSGSFREPQSVALDAKGDIWIADTKENEIQEFNENGEFIRRFGTEGTGSGQFREPKGIAVGLGYVWVTDTGNNRIERFNESNGEYVGSYGSEGTGNTQFKAPTGIAFAGESFFVADKSNNRIVKWSKSGPFNLYSYKAQVGVSGAGNGQFKSPSGVAVDSKGNVWVVDTLNRRIQEFNEKLEYVAQVGSLGTANGKFEEPEGIAVDPKGNVWVADTWNSRVQEFNEKLEYLGKFGTKGQGVGQLNNPAGIAADAKGNIWVADNLNNRLQKFAEKTPEYAYVRQLGAWGTASEQFKVPAGIGIDPKGNMWIADAQDNRLDEFNEKAEFLKSIGSEGSGNGQFNEPKGLAVDASGNVWVLESGNSRIQEFNEKGEFVRTFGSWGSGNGQFEFPKGIAVDSKKNVWAVDAWKNRVEEFTEKGEFIRVFGTEGSGNGQFKNPTGIVADSKGNIWVTDWNSSRVEEFNEKGEFIKSFTAQGFGITVDGAGNFWIADGTVAHEYSESGELKATFGSAGEGPGHFEGATWVAVDKKGNIWIPNVGSYDISQWQVVEKVEAEAIPPAPGATVDYGVPMSGAGAPYSMTSAELERWAQKDDPAEATAIFPPDEPQGTIPSDYKRATVYYLDGKGRTVNTAGPGGAISTSEYNSTDDEVRSLSPDNRTAALKEGAKSAEAAGKRDTQSTYNAEGTELLSTLGPKHAVKLPIGTEVQARSHTVYSYDEGAPAEGGPYRLATKVTQGAQIEGEAEQDVRTTTTSYSGQENLGWKLRKPTSVITEPAGLKLTTTTVYDPTTGNVTETKSPAGSSGSSGTEAPVYSSSFGTAGTGNGQLKAPEGVALTAKGELLVADEKNSRIEAFNEKGEFVKTIGSLGTGVGQMKEPRGVAVDGKGNIWVADTANNRVDEFNEKAEFVRTLGFGVTNGEGKFQICTASCVAGLNGSGAGEFKEEKGIAADQHNNVIVADTGNSRIEKFNEKGEYQATWGSSGTGNGQFKEPRGISVAPNGSIWIADLLNNRVEVISESGVFQNSYGSVGTGNLQFKEPKAIFVDTHGKVWVSDSKNSRVQVLNEKGEYQFQFGSSGTGSGQFKEPWGVELDSHGDIFVSDQENNRIQKWVAAGPGPEAHDNQFIYYSTAANEKYPACGEHPEWANLLCESKPAAQPGTSGLPELPISTTTYNVLDESEVATQTVGTTTRTSKATYDAAGRILTSSVSSSVGSPLPMVTYEYDPESGEILKASTTVEGKTQSISSIFNKLGQTTSYTDASGNVSTVEYEPEGDRRPVTVSDGKGTQTFGYDETTAELTKLVDSAAGTFTASYDVEGNLTTEGYPNGMSGNYTYNANGEHVALEYLKTTHCTEKCVWYSDSIVPSIHGQTMSQASTLASDAYSYDNAGRLAQVQETPAGKGCLTRLYAYDEDTNRLSLTHREPGTEGKCATEGGTAETHSYDSADRLTDTGIKYETFGNITNLPAADAGGTELASSFYTNNHLASQTQNGETISYPLDPARRVSEVISTGKTVASVVNHYAGAGDTPAWTSELSSQWTRNIEGIGVGLAAIQHTGETPVLQLTDLKGDIVATAAKSEMETKLLGTNRTTEYGVPTTEAPAKYTWLGAHELPTELPSGIVAMGARSYVPELGRFLQTDPRPGGSANAYTYTYGDPVDSIDPSGEYTLGGPSQALVDGTAQEASEAAAEQAAENAAAKAEAEREAQEEVELIASYENEEEWEEEEGEEESEEYASYHSSGQDGGAVFAEGLSWRPFEKENSGGVGFSEEETSGDQSKIMDVRVVCNDHGLCHGNPGRLHGKKSKSSYLKDLAKKAEEELKDKVTEKASDKGKEYYNNSVEEETICRNLEEEGYHC
jgi:RHS repeat-associated protein